MSALESTGRVVERLDTLDQEDDDVGWYVAADIELARLGPPGAGRERAELLRDNPRLVSPPWLRGFAGTEAELLADAPMTAADATARFDALMSHIDQVIALGPAGWAAERAVATRHSS